MPKCDKCDREFKNDLALKIHVGRMHGKKGKTAKKAGRPRKAASAGKLACRVCGRKFKLAMHLARHSSAAHGKRRKVGRPRGRRAAIASAPRAVDVRAMAIDQLLSLKRQVDGRLREVVRRLRLARVGV